ncbi:uncharacterized protein MKZ38_000289 [Zalerion maritima]|uniref:Cytosolic regulator Pianissimo n=1 Tax=Zalerion maritima TaxID=339359 RepID=A0AAD5RSG3_9PEZI|nr:uncharacterized protein MKZ38_000289 [Zalerion maritima]
MVGPSPLLSSSAGSATPTQKSFSAATTMNSRASFERDNLQPPNPANGTRNLSSSAVSFGPRGSSLNPSIGPGSFSSELRSQMSSRAGASSRADLYTNLEKLDEDDDAVMAEESLNHLREALKREEKIKEGSENMLEALNNKKAKQSKEQRNRVEAELSQSNQRIKDLRQKIYDTQHVKAAPTTPTRALADGFFPNNTAGSNTGVRSPPGASRSGAGSDFDDAPEVSPSYALAETLQALEVEGMTPEYYVSRANSLVELFKKHPTLKYDLVWSIFGLRMQVMLLSESREVVAAGYRMIRYAISDVSSLKKIRSLNTDYLVILSLIKERKADVEREQALKFVRAFLDVKDGVHEVSRAVVRTIAAVAEQGDDRLMSICIETLAEILVRDPPLLISSGGLAVLSEALSEGLYKSPESLAGAFLFLLDHPQRRKYLRAGYELEVLFTAFTDSLLANETLLKQNSAAISSALRSWPGLMNLSMFDLRAIRSLISSLMLPTPMIKETVLDIIYNLLRIKSPGWASSFLAGRRLTTYGRVATLKSTAAKGVGATYVDEAGDEQNFVEHYTALLLAIFIRAGLLPALLEVTKDTETPMLKRKATLLIGETLKLASRLLPPSWSSDIQLLPDLFSAATRFETEDHYLASQVVYQISSVSRTLYRSSPSIAPGTLFASNATDSAQDDQPKGGAQVNLDDAGFRQLLIDSAVLSSSNSAKWNWDTIFRLIDGPLTNGKRLEEALKASKFIKRIISFYRPFKYKFSELKNNRSNQKYVRVGCALMSTLLQSPEGLKYLADSKLLRQIAECLAQCDPTSGLTAQYPMFSPDRLLDTLAMGYFPMLGVLSSDTKGLQMLDRWRMFNMMYHIVDRQQRPDLIKLLLSHFDYNLQGHPRLLLSKSLTAGTKDIRIHATNVLRKYACGPRPGTVTHGVADSKWAIQLLVTQLYDPEVEVCATVVKILEKACNNKSYLEYVVECRPSLDHLGEIGAPLLLRFLSTSIGYHYLDGLDYISNEMDDWFLGRNDSYVSVVEASLARAFAPDSKDKDDAANRMSILDDGDMEPEPHVPPHFYRELTRTKEGCDLLRQKRHFDEFANTIRDYGMQYDDSELITKVKGCLWAVGNVGSMELGAEFLESTDVVQHVVEIAQNHEVMSLRGTAFFVLGLISRSIHGLEIMSELGWDSNTSAMGNSLGFCIPTDLGNFLSLEPWKHESIARVWLPETQRTMAQIEVRSSELIESEKNSTSRRILELVVDLGNTVLFRKTMGELLLLRQKKAIGFRQVGLFRKVMVLLEQHHYRLNVRRAVVECFDKAVLRCIVFEEEGEEISEEAGGRSRGASKSSVQGHSQQRHARHSSRTMSEGMSSLGARRINVRDIKKEAQSDSDEDDEDEDEEGSEELSSGDEQRTERQRSVSDPGETR